MTALVDRPVGCALPPDRVRWKWHLFEADELVHLYRVAELRNSRLYLLRPWCVLDDRYPLDHDRPSIDLRNVIPRRGGTCPKCAAHTSVVIPHPRTGTPVAGEFAGELFEVVTRRGHP